MSKHNFDQYLDRRGTDSIKWSAYPEDVLPMWVADSDFAAPAPVLEALASRIAHPAFGYADDNALPVLDKAARHWMKSRFGWDLPAGSSAFAPGVITSVCMAVEAFTRPGDKVLTLSPSYPPLIHKAGLNKRQSIASPMRADQNGYYSIDFADLEQKLALPETTLFLLCNPHNPTGRVFSREELLKMGELCLKHGVTVLSDEIHCDYTHQGEHIPFPTLSADLAAITVVSINPSKTFNIAGLHTAAVLSENPKLLARFRAASDAAGLHANILGVAGFSAAYMQCAYYADEVREYVRGNQVFAVDFITREIPGLNAALPEATYLLWVDCRELGLGQSELMDLFIKKARVAPGSGSNYNSLGGNEGDGFIRLNLACPRKTVEEALERIRKALA